MKDNSVKDSTKNAQFSSLVDIFEAIGISEKGIEIVYDYLLRNKKIEDPKTIFEKLDLSLKRVYKIFSVLKDLGLIQIYDRPMKIVINDPIKSWQTIISKHINEYREETNKKVQICENTFQFMLKAYQLSPDSGQLPPVEFISIESDPFEFLLNEITAEKMCLIAKGVTSDNPVLSRFRNLMVNVSKKGEEYQNLTQFIKDGLARLPNVHYRILISEEYFNDAYSRIREFEDKYPEIVKLVENVQLSLEIKSIPKQFSNFIVKDEKALCQFSVDPNNQLIGIFISKQKEIVQIFTNKFNELCKNAKEIYPNGLKLSIVQKLGFLVY